MKLKYAIKHDNKLYPAGDYPAGNKRLPDVIEAEFIKLGYFEITEKKVKK